VDKKLKKTHRQLNGLKEDFNQLKNETKELMKKKREINEIKKTVQDMKEELNKDGKSQINQTKQKLWKQKFPYIK
jgi:prefoldin subunit 5